MLLVKKRGYVIENGKLKKSFNIQMEKTNKGYHIMGFNNNKIINKSVTYIKNKGKNKSKKVKNKSKKVKK
jgi:hypothetical protein